MCSKRIEIELKYQLKNISSVIGTLERSSRFVDESIQIDSYYNSPARDFLDCKHNISHWLRVRESDGNCSINYKIWQPEDSENQTHCIEYESGISSPKTIHQLLVALGFDFLVAVKKNRRCYLMEEVEISIDQIDGLGDFMELEYKGDLDDIDKAREKLFSCLNWIGADVFERDKIGYPYALLIKNGKVPSP